MNADCSFPTVARCRAGSSVIFGRKMPSACGLTFTSLAYQAF